MNLKITPHAQYRLVERGISVEKVKKVILYPNKTLIQDDGSIKAIGKSITVVYKRTLRQYVIITAYGN